MISWKEKKMNEFVKEEEIKNEYRNLYSLLNIIKIRRSKWYGHVVGDSGPLKSIILQGKLEGAKSRGGPRRMFVDDVTEWMAIDETTSVERADDRRWWRKETIRSVHQRLRLRL